MAARKMTFSLPEEIALRFLGQVPAQERSRYIAQALDRSLRSEEEDLVRACLLANEDTAAREVEEEFTAIPDPLEESWDDAPTR